MNVESLHAPCTVRKTYVSGLRHTRAEVVHQELGGLGEARTLNEICENAASLWEVGRGEDWRCDFSQKRFRQLQALLLTPAQTPKPGSNRCATAKVIG